MPRPKNYPLDLRDRLVAAAFEYLRLRDPEHMSLRDLAAECDTSTNAVYSMFGSKDALIDEVAAVARRDFLDPQFALAEGEPTLATLTASGHHYRTWALANPGLYRLLFGGAARTRHVPRAEMVEPIRLMPERMQGAGVLAPHDSEEMSLSLWASTHGFVRWRCPCGAPTPPNSTSSTPRT